VSAEPLREEAEEVPAESPELATMHAGARRHARSVAPALPLPEVAEPESDTLSLPELVQMVRSWLRERVSTAAERKLDLIHGPPPTVAALHARHAKAAAHWNGAIPRNLRLLWGLIHTLVTVLAYTAADALFSPAGAILAAGFIYLCITRL
jgi:hypothetical protein